MTRPPEADRAARVEALVEAMAHLALAESEQNIGSLGERINARSNVRRALAALEAAPRPTEATERPGLYALPDRDTLARALWEVDHATTDTVCQSWEEVLDHKFDEGYLKAADVFVRELARLARPDHRTPGSAP